MFRFSRRCFVLGWCAALAVVGMVTSAVAAEELPSLLMLWFRQPAQQWVEALPIGNGRLGGMVFGGVAEEHVQLNDDALWAGGPKDRCNPKALEALPEVRRRLFAGKNDDATNLASRTMMGIPPRIESYQTLGDLRLKFPGGRQTDGLSPPARSGCRHCDGDVSARRRAIHAGIPFLGPGPGVGVRLTCDKPGRISFYGRDGPPAGIGRPRPSRPTACHVRGDQRRPGHEVPGPSESRAPGRQALGRRQSAGD